MKSKPVLIFKSYLTGFPTALPANVYALPDGSIYLVYTRFYEKDFSKTSLEYVFAELEEFSIDYDSGQLFDSEVCQISLEEFKLMMGKENPALKIVKVSRRINSTEEALPTLNRMAQKVSKNKSL